MRRIFRGVLAGWGASKLGGGCITTIIIFLVLWWILRGVGI
jgi:hypothetical protein